TLVTVAGSKAHSLLPYLAFYPEPVTTALRQRSRRGYSVATGDVAGAGVAAAFCDRLAATFFTAFHEAFTGAFFTAACLATTGAVFTPAAFFAAHLFFKVATIAALPALLSLRLGLGAPSGAEGSDCFFAAAHRFRWASAIRARPAALILCLGFASGSAPLLGPKYLLSAIPTGCELLPFLLQSSAVRLRSRSVPFVESRYRTWRPSATSCSSAIGCGANIFRG